MNNENRIGTQISKLDFVLQRTEIKLVEDVKDCQSEKWDELWAPYKKHRVPSWIRLLISGNDVRDVALFLEDCIHDLHWKIFSALKNKRPKNPKVFGRYVYVSVRNYIISWQRSWWSDVGAFPKGDMPNNEPWHFPDIELEDFLMQLEKWVLADEDFGPMEKEIIIGCCLAKDKQREERKEMAERLGVPRHDVDNTLKKFSKKYRKKVYKLIGKNYKSD